MPETIFNLLFQQKQNIAVIGADAMGVSTACILAKLGVAKVSIFEAESKAFNENRASVNNTGVLIILFTVDIKRPWNIFLSKVFCLKN